ncbi:xylulokinase [Lacticaseibacillus baoqingensis]|uniref:Xylulokinase n=1 Tax=Lacticaseibacillus baoqingensis TaxID=2486013 RepID=A0ABW4ECF3_9LACO|nr:FGGY-family carbohydrate kinase [Lacticaseibacillus baoqingensis]
MTIDPTQEIQAGKATLGIELGSTNIKAVLIGSDFSTLASGSFGWENQFIDGNWTYALEQVWTGIQSSYTALKQQVQSRYGVALTQVGAIGISAMMHGYLAFDQAGKQLVSFRTWRNNTTAPAADALTAAFGFNIPQRWSIAHFYQAILNQEPHVPAVDYFTTLAGYVHWQLSGEKVIGIGDASGMFPIDSQTKQFDTQMLATFDNLMQQHGLPQAHVAVLMPQPLVAGSAAGHLTAAGAKLLDVSGTLAAGAVMAPPEGDAGTGMTGTNAVRPRTGNISAGTSAFSMVVLEQPLKAVYRDIDLVTTPEGAAVAMVHANNCTSDINAWVGLFKQFAELIGADLKPDELYAQLFNASANSDADAGGLLNYAYLSGENLTQVEAGRPLFVRTPNSHFTLANFIKSQLYSAFAPLKIGNDILAKKEHIPTDKMIAQGGIFRTPKIAQQVLADALNTPITVTANAGEGGPWGMAVLAAYVQDARGTNELADYLDQQVFASGESTTIAPTPAGVAGYDAYIRDYQAGLSAELAAQAIADHQG